MPLCFYFLVVYMVFLNFRRYEEAIPFYFNLHLL